MNGKLSVNQSVRLLNGASAKVLKVLGEGGQGIVYLVDVGGRKMALKWYKTFESRRKADAFYDNLQKNISRGAPSDAFLWPEYLTAKSTSGQFGYLMKLRPDEYSEFGSFILGKVGFSGMRTRLIAARKLCEAFMALHRQGLSYQDLNDGNIFMNPASGDVLICDNDNVFPYGSYSGIAGKVRYMAPEIVLGKNLPDVHSDRFSLALILFMLLYGNHPFEGKVAASKPCLTEEIEKKIYGSEILFIMDPSNSSNRPVRNIHTNVVSKWSPSPAALRAAFIEEFSQNKLRNPQSRMPESEWLRVLETVNDALVKCPHCGHDTFYADKCLRCGKAYKSDTVLSVGQRRIPLMPNNLLFIGYGTKPDARTIVNPKTGGLYVQNGSGHEWMVETPSGKMVRVENGGTIPANKDLRINFSNNLKGIII